jgi:hypothetical protein
VTVRVYLPTTLERLREEHAAGAVTVGADAVAAEADDEESEYAALMTAADASAAMLAGPGRRVVVVAALPSVPTEGARVPFRDVVAVHADTEDRAPDADPDEDLGWFATQEIGDVVLDMR